MQVHIQYLNENKLLVQCDAGIAQELADYFTFTVPNHRFIPSVRNKMWDGKIRLFNQRNNSIYVGLKYQIEKICQERGYEYSEDQDFSADSFSVNEAREWLSTQTFSLTPRDYQLVAFVKSIRERRKLFLSPTSSGKSFIIFITTCYLNQKTLIIVPRIDLVSQMRDDMISYDPSIADDIHCIFSGESKNTDKQITITTWQSIYKQPKAWFNKFKVVHGDEVHLFKAKSLVGIMEACDEVPYRFGYTGTINDSLTNIMVLEGLFSKIDKTITTAELMDRGEVANLTIKCIVLDYPDTDKKLVKQMNYQQEIDYIVGYEKRNKFIANLAHSLNGNVLILYRFVEKHGELLHKLVLEKNKSNRPIYYVWGGVDKDVRADIRHLIDKQLNSITVASLGTFSTGISIKNINYIILATPAKSKENVLQSIGRGLRISDIKDSVVWFDVADDLSWKSSKNHTLLHYAERIKIYNSEKFTYKQYRIKI